MNLRRIATILATTAAVAVGVTTCSVSPAAAAEIPKSVAGPQVNGGFVRGACTVTADAAKCAVRFPQGFRRVNVEYSVGGRWLGTEESWDRTIAGRPHGTVRRFDRNIGTGVRLECLAVGAVAYCDLDMADRYRDFNIAFYNAGSLLGGIKVKGLLFPGDVGYEDPNLDVQPDPIEEDVEGGEVIDLTGGFEPGETVVTQVFVPVLPWTPVAPEQP